MRTWKDNAAEFGALTKQGVDVRLAVLVACSVEKGMGQGARQPLNERTEVEKVSAVRFGESAGTSQQRISRHLDAWNKAAANGLCKPSADLTPADAADPDLVVPTDTDFRSMFDAGNAGARPRASRGEIADAIATKADYARSLVASMPVEAKANLAEALADDEEGEVEIRRAHNKVITTRYPAAKHANPDDRAPSLPKIDMWKIAHATSSVRDWIDEAAAANYQLTDEQRDAIAAAAVDLGNYVAVLTEIAAGTIRAGLTDDDLASLLDGGK